MSTSKKQQNTKLWVRVVCIGLIIIMVGSTVLAAMGLF